MWFLLPIATALLSGALIPLLQAATRTGPTVVVVDGWDSRLQEQFCSDLCLRLLPVYLCICGCPLGLRFLALSFLLTENVDKLWKPPCPAGFGFVTMNKWPVSGLF